MENFKAIQFLFTVEKYLNIHRDIKFLAAKKLILTTFFILLDSVLGVFISIDNFAFIYRILYSNPLYFYGVLIIQGLYRMLSYLCVLYFAPRYSGEFSKLISSLSCAHHIVVHLPSYKKSLNNLKVKVMVAVIVSAVVRIGFNVNQVALHIGYLVGHNESKMKASSSSLLYYLFKGLTEVRYMIGVSVYCAILATMSIILQALTMLAEKAADTGLDSLGDHLDDYATVYRELVRSSQHLKKCFNEQILFSAFIATAHFIYLMYRIIVQLTKGDFEIFSQPVTIHLVTYIILLIFVARCGQGIRNDVMAFYRTLARIRCRTGTPNKGVKDLQRLVSSEPLTIILMPPLPVGMYFLPAVLSFIVQYTIVTLQMNDKI